VQNLRSRVNSEDQPGSEAEIDTDVDILFDSQDVESDGEAGTTNLVTSSGRARATKTASPPSLQQSLALSYMATQFLRLPIFLGDILMWAKSGSLLYHDASAQIPREMYQRLPSTYQKQFRPQIHLTNGQVLHSVTKLVLMYNKDFGLVLPSLNLPVHLFRMVEELALPLEVYSAARRLAAFMKFDFSYPNVTNDCITIIDLPEAQVVACIIVVLKLFYGFDDIKRIPTAETSPGAAIIDWHEWARIMRDSAPLDDQEAMQMTDREIIDLPDGKVDDYLDFFQEHFTVEDPQDKDKDADFRKMIMGLFPVGSRSTKKRDVQDYVSTLKQENVQVMQASLKPNKVIFEMDEMDLEDKDKAIIRPGESYQKHRNAYELTGHAKAFYIVVSQISGLPVKSICRALVHAEMRLKHLRKGKIPRGRQPKRHHKSKYRLNTEELASDIVGSEFGDELRSEMDMRSEKGDYDLHIGMDDGEREVNSEMGEL
jgi:RNA polymerase I-specific transcription initiation factor RRN7